MDSTNCPHCGAGASDRDEHGNVVFECGSQPYMQTSGPKFAESVTCIRNQLAAMTARAEAAESKLSACERERDALKRRLEPLTEDEAKDVTGIMIARLGAKVTGDDGHMLAIAYANVADRIRARRA